ncbi:MAG: hypothetical protein ACOY3U_12175 [Bacillota bacterium]
MSWQVSQPAADYVKFFASWSICREISINRAESSSREAVWDSVTEAFCTTAVEICWKI